MNDAAIDLLDRRGRLRRLAAASALGLLITMVVVQLIASVASVSSTDPIGKMSVIVCAVGVFLVATSFAHMVIARITRRLTPSV
jgi:energy-converting hydrogenase Eha subunit E